MSLILTVLSFKNQAIGQSNTAAIGTNGGGIGRSDDNALVLPDTEKFVSRHHATISFENGCYYLSDTSLGGVFINNRDTPLHNATERLENGMTLKVGEYEIAVAIRDEQVTDDFMFASEPKTDTYLHVDEPWVASEEVSFNSLMTDNFPSHDELVQVKTDTKPTAFESALPVNQSPLFDSYIAPTITPPPIASANEEIPENFSFDDFFSETAPAQQTSAPALNKATVDNDFEDFFDAALGDMASELEQAEAIPELPEPKPEQTPSSEIPLFDFESLTFSSDKLPVVQIPELEIDKEDEITNEPFGDQLNEQVALAKKNELSQQEAAEITDNSLFESESALFESFEPSATSIVEPQIKLDTAVNLTGASTTSEHVRIPVNDRPLSQQFQHKEEVPATPVGNSNSSQADSVLFSAFLQGADVECDEMVPEQQAETLHRIGQMFRKLIDGTVAVLRSRAEFKSLCRVNMTVIRAANNNPLKFTVATDDVLRQLIENKTDGFLASTLAIEESFDDIMNHQLAMQAGIQASLTDLLKTFDPKIIEKQFEHGLVLQKKSKCWDKYEETYRNTVDEAVENFFGEEFVKAYEKQMSQLKNSRR